MVNQLVDVLQQHKPLSPEELAVISASFHQIEVAEDEYVFSGNKVCSNFYFICKGVLKFVSSDDQGQDVAHYFMTENHFCTVLESFVNRKVTTDRIQAACDTTILTISFEALQKVYENYPGLKKSIEEIIQQQLIEKINLKKAYHSRNALSRYKFFMETQPTVLLRVKMQDIASYLGIAPQSLSRLRKQIS